MLDHKKPPWFYITGSSVFSEGCVDKPEGRNLKCIFSHGNVVTNGDEMSGGALSRESLGEKAT